ncbi:MAG: hypothetical protein IIU22_00150 [Firmicutes bacterium]|nr:hypothetical protein [Bacillota bacterium]
MIRIHGIKLRLDQGKDRLIRKAERQLRVPAGTIESARIAKESLDAREKPMLYRVYSLDIESSRPDEWLIEACKRTGTRWSEEKEEAYRPLPLGFECSKRPVIAGFGPCGIFAALALAQYGLRPVVLERGGRMDERIEAVERFWKGGSLDPECNVQFGEGGAGTFSDGKLTTGTRSPYSRWILEQFADAGASPEILYKQKPHIGTDVLRGVVVEIRKKIESLGGEVRFGCRLEELVLEGGALSAVKYSAAKTEGPDGAPASGGRIMETLETDALILALGHSARDTVRALYAAGIRMEQKPFSIGVRIEHPQSLIDLAQYGALHEDLGIGPADYKLNVKTSSGRGVYTFCMCPGGYVINASSAPGMLAVNGMSNSDRGSGTANSALLADVLPEDYAAEGVCSADHPEERGSHPLAGMAFQEKYERLAFELGGGNPPRQTVGSFLGTKGAAPQTAVKTGSAAMQAAAIPSGAAIQENTSADLTKCLPGFASDALKEALPLLGKKLKGFDSPDAVLTALESRSSSPVRIKRDPETLQAIPGLFPAGEGAGYAGGIMSAAADGVRAAEQVKKFCAENKKQ